MQDHPHGDRYVRREHLDGPWAVCRNCGQRLVLVPEVGWTDPVAGHSQDICPADPFGNHDPKPIEDGPGASHPDQ